MPSFPLKLRDGHLFVTIDNHDWLLDTGSPTSFGNVPSLVVENRTFHIPEHYMGLTTAKLSEYVGHPTVGIMGADVFNEFDILLDVPKGQVSFTEAQLTLDGAVIRTDACMGIPIIQATIDGTDRRMFFDTGAQISYFQGESLTSFPGAGTITDFYPGFGQFQTKTYQVDIILGNECYRLRCGSLPPPLGMTLMLANTDGIIGNEILQNRKSGFLPRRRQLVLSPRNVPISG
jgi:hypothetical protein